MESMYVELALYRNKNECARTDNVFFPISEVSDGWFPVELYGHKKSGLQTKFCCHPLYGHKYKECKKYISENVGQTVQNRPPENLQTFSLVGPGR